MQLGGSYASLPNSDVTSHRYGIYVASAAYLLILVFLFTGSVNAVFKR